eukprot:TRINITY_DN6830_c0_g3_i10.p1 TRINITY_DN6830_c0_g3~~TRINITY_DN6830_c0_g3_i10.p1  ORF type:complete len:341 (-),score=61.19 TRINITY_DN6830_c0_g3_i10:144-1166(-)
MISTLETEQENILKELSITRANIEVLKFSQRDEIVEALAQKLHDGQNRVSSLVSKVTQLKQELAKKKKEIYVGFQELTYSHEIVSRGDQSEDENIYQIISSLQLKPASFRHNLEMGLQKQPGGGGLIFPPNTQPGLFCGNSSTPFGQTSSTFGGFSSTSQLGSGQGFGGSSASFTGSSASSGFSFGSVPTGNPSVASSPFGFGNSSTPSFGSSVAPYPASSSTPSLGSSPVAPYPPGFGNSSTPSFGSSPVVPYPPGFGNSSTPSFGSSPVAPSSTGFGNSSIGFGSSPVTPSTGFSFGSSPVAPSSTGFGNSSIGFGSSPVSFGGPPTTFGTSSSFGRS